jgi:hypothetical protein
MPTKKQIPDDWWNHGINPILGYKYEPLTNKRPERNRFEYPKCDDYKLNTNDNG